MACRAREGILGDFLCSALSWTRDMDEGIADLNGLWRVCMLIGRILWDGNLYVTLPKARHVAVGRRKGGGSLRTTDLHIHVVHGR